MERKDQVARDKQSCCAHSDISNDMACLVESPPKSSSATVVSEALRLAPEVLACSLTNDRTFYRYDVVRRNKLEGSLGVVMEVAGDSDSEGNTTDGSNIDDSDVSKVRDCIDEDAARNGEMCDEDLSTLPDGQVRIVWTDGSESTDNINDITVVDRGFLHGDIVASASDPTGQLGLVVDVSIRIGLQTSNGEMIQNISSKDLKRIREFSIGDYVVWGPWLGRVNDVLDNVTVLFEDGSVCKVVKADPLRLKAVSRPVIDDEDCPYYPGQRVRATSSSVFRSSRWLSGFWKAGRNEGTVIKVQTASVIVYWMSSAYLGVGTTSDVPSEEQNPNDLSLLSCFSYANWQLGDWCLFQPSIAIKTDDSENVEETEEECGATCPEKSLMDDPSFHDSKPRTRIIEQVLQVTNLSKGHQPSDPVCTMLAVDGKNNNITDTVGYNSVDHLVPEQILDCHTKNSFASVTDRKIKLQDNDFIKGQSNPTETIPVMHECGSCNITPSISREPSHDGWPAYRRKLRKVLLKRERKACRKDENFERALLIVNTVTKVDVAWQDGTREYGLDSICLIPINTPSDQDFFPEQYVVEKTSNEDDDSVESNRVGIVRSVNSKDRTACVRWFKPVLSPEDLREFSSDEIVSVYELDGHPDYDYCYGDVVVRLSPVSASDSYLEIPPEILGEQTDVTESETAVTKKHSEHKLELSEGEPSGKFRSLSWVGNIRGLQGGDIEVVWADGMVSKVGPQAVYVVGREDDADSYDGGSDVGDDNASWETVDENEMDMLHDAEEESHSQCAKISLACEKAEDNPSEDIVPGKPGAFSASLAAINFVTRLATGLFSRNKRNSDLSNSDHNALCGSEAHDVLEVAVNRETDADLVSSKHKSQGTLIGDAERMVSLQIESSTSNVPSLRGESEACLHNFKHFDICDCPADHYFLSSIGQCDVSLVIKGARRTKAQRGLGA
ncbi:putative ubiquitin-conjugating enzyme E2 23 [Platanthera zijinensis]|uniref:Ubiquitin-conjugating enzyme E2 23 n=1 Tax=Platanthera zijinensis TaxID=2320716 RepID=A0AAP0B149_9ASPA